MSAASHLPNSAVYTGTKGAVDAITGVLSRELGPKKIRVNTLNPGIVETEGTHSAGFIGSDFEKVVVAQTPLGRIGQVGDIAPLAVFLASEDYVEPFAQRWLERSARLIILTRGSEGADALSKRVSVSVPGVKVVVADTNRRRRHVLGRRHQAP